MSATTSCGHPHLHPEVGFRGRDSFGFTASNGLGTGGAIVTIDVAAAPNRFRLGRPKRKRRKGIAKLPAVPGAGALVLRAAMV
ncbi:MAG TPA: hypothetical protein VK919_00390 [Solirubrobacterales bacterium]|nr:hypothetical protein [Solirubrobacterales bacterium]